ncbi:UNVERIFIED_CONTAM: hypothetical protein GTU68_058268 [Idotea baltica]|nr:hypothetical protein [Idotea baltica]
MSIDTNVIQLSIIVAVAENGVVGRNNALPWHIPADLQFFKRTTLGKPIVMGRKTYESIGRALPGRTNIVVSRNDNFSAKGVTVVSSIEAALSLAEDIALIDGIYAAAIPLAHRLYITEVHSKVDGDAYLPEIDWRLWSEISRERHSAVEPNTHDFSFVIYERV